MIHKFQMNGLNFVLDVPSGAVHVVDQLTYQLIGDQAIETSHVSKEISEQEITSRIEEIQSLVDQGLLYSPDEYINHVDSAGEPILKAMCLNVAHDCNLKCAYCFAKQGNFGGNPQLMSLEVGKKSLQYLVDHSGNRRNLEVDFFGGEPLMNFDVVKDLVEYGNVIATEKNKHFRFTITTNGLLLDDEKIDYINQKMSNVVLSLDGRKEINDAMRPTLNDKGSYDIIVPKFQQLIQERGNHDYYVRGTFTRENLDFAKDAKHFKDLGFSITSIEPVVDADSSNPYAIQEADLPKILSEYEDFAKEYVKDQIGGSDFKFFHFMIDLSQGPCIVKRIRGCGAGGEYVCVTPEGDVYPCHQFVGNEAFKMGNVMDQSDLNPDISDQFKDLNVFTKPDCGACWAKYYCSGGCHANAWNFNRDLKKPYALGCEMERKRVECAIMIEATKALHKA